MVYLSSCNNAEWKEGTLIYSPHEDVSLLLSDTGEWYKENGHAHGLQKNKCLVRKSNALKPKGSFTVCVCKEYQNCLQHVNIPGSPSKQR